VEKQPRFEKGKEVHKNLNVRAVLQNVQQ